MKARKYTRVIDVVQWKASTNLVEKGLFGNGSVNHLCERERKAKTKRVRRLRRNWNKKSLPFPCFLRALAASSFSSSFSVSSWLFPHFLSPSYSSSSFFILCVCVCLGVSLASAAEAWFSRTGGTWLCFLRSEWEGKISYAASTSSLNQKIKNKNKKINKKDGLADLIIVVAMEDKCSLRTSPTLRLDTSFSEFSNQK